MRILMISGAYPPDVCGVGDYTFQLMNTKTARSSECGLYISRNWRLFSFFRKVRDINSYDAELLFIQSPTKGYGWSILPHITTAYYSIFTKRKTVVMLHEYLQLSSKSRLATKIMLATANHVIFSNETDRDAVVKDFPRLAKRNSIIKIFSNIPSVEQIKPVSEREIDLVNFGQIRPGRGIEEFLEAVKGIQRRKIKIRTLLAGQVRPEYAKYFLEIKRQCEELGIEMCLNYDDEKTAELLNNCKFAYLPYPDGISERRGSFLATAYNGVIVISNEGKFTTEELKSSVQITSLDESVKIIERIIALDEQSLNVYQSKGRNFIFSNMHRSWEDVMSKYIELAKELLKQL